MTWEEYYDKFYDWAESTQIKKLSSVEELGTAEEVADVMLSLAFDHEEIANRIARKAIKQGLIFKAEDIVNLTNSIDPELQEKLALQSVSGFSKEDIDSLDDVLDEDILIQLYNENGLPVPEIYDDMDESDGIDDMGYQPEEEKTIGFFGKMAMALGIGYGIKKGINAVQESRAPKFRIGDHVRVKYRGQEGTIIDINGSLYMVSLNDGNYVDSFAETDLERAW